LAAVLAAGAEAAWMGTAFLLCEEADTTADARSRIAKAEATDTILTAVFDRVNDLAWPPEHPGRALRNAFAERWNGREAELTANRDEVARFRRAAEQRDYDVTSIYAGQAVGLLQQVTQAREMVERIGLGAERILRERIPSMLAMP
jgi:nitronate monooxygenase